MNGLVEMIQSLETIAKMGEEIRDFAQEILPSNLDYAIILKFRTELSRSRSHSCEISKKLLPLPVTQIKFLLDHEI